jgi:hypothetical protein
MTGSEGLPEAASGRWRRLVDEAEELAEEYRDRGWEAMVVHPADVTAVDTDDQFGLNALAPNSEYERVRSLVAAHAFDQSHVYRQTDDGLRLFLCVFEATEEVAVLVPAYVTETDLDMLFPRAREIGEMHVLVRPLEHEERATLTVADPALFFEAED